MVRDPESLDSVVRNARHNANIAWLRLPVSLVVSGFLFTFVDAATGWTWLAAVLLIEAFAWHVRRRLVHGDLRFRIPHLVAIAMVCLAWVTLAFLVWNSDAEIPRIATVVTLFSVAIYGVVGGYKSAPILLVLVLPPLISLFVLLVGFAWTSLDSAAALLTTVATLAACMTVAVTGWALHKSDKGLETANADLRRLTSRLAGLADREREASNAKDAFLANLSHEIRTPLNGINGLIATLETRALSARDQNSLEAIRQSGEILERLISDVLDAAAIGAGKLHIQERTFDPAALARSAFALIETEASRKGLSSSLTVAPDVPQFLIGDDIRIRQVVLNLLSNAIKFTDTGQVTLEVGICETAAPGPGTQLKISVIDTGRGLDPNSATKLFERFERGEPSTIEATTGLGLGLAISRTIVSAMGGEIRISSAPGAGSKFEIILPLLPAPAPTGEAQERSEGDESGVLPAALSGRPLRILLAEDHPINRLVATTILETMGASIEISVDGREAIDAATRGAFDLILMDLLMPVIDGLEAVRAIRRHEAENGLVPVPIIMLTASALPSRVELAMQAGCNAYLSKPVTPQRLLEAVREALDQRPVKAATG